MKAINRKTLSLRLGAVAVAVGIGVAGCGGSSSTGASTPAPTKSTSSGAGGGGSAATSQVLPVTKNPIQNTSTVQALKIASMLVDNNVDSKNRPVTDHLELALQNTGATTLSSFEVFYTFTDSKTKGSESYYFKLPDSFTIPAGGTRTVHFDDTGAPDHFPVNKYSLYYTAKNPLTVSVTVSAANAAVQITSATKTPSTGESASQ